MASNNLLWYIVVVSISVAGIMTSGSPDRLELLLIVTTFAMVVPVLYYLIDIRSIGSDEERTKEELYHDAASRMIIQRYRRKRLSEESTIHK